MTWPNGAGRKFDKLMRFEPRKDDAVALSVLKRVAPALAKTIDDIDGMFAEILAGLRKIEDAEAALSRSPRGSWPARAR